MRCFFGVHQWETRLVLPLLIFQVQERGDTLIPSSVYSAQECAKCGSRQVHKLWQFPFKEVTERANQWVSRRLKDERVENSFIYINAEHKLELASEYAKTIDCLFNEIPTLKHVETRLGKPILELVK